MSYFLRSFIPCANLIRFRTSKSNLPHFDKSFFERFYFLVPPYSNQYFMSPLHRLHSTYIPLDLDINAIDDSVSIFEKLTQKLSSKPILKSKIKSNEVRIKQIILCMKRFSIEENDIVCILSKNSSLIYCDEDFLEKIFTELLNLGFTSNNIKELLLSHSNVKKVSLKQLISSLEALRYCTFSHEEGVEMISLCPKILSTSQKNIEYQMDLLANYFSRKSAIKIASLSPRILVDSWQSTLERIEYVMNVMGLPSKVIAGTPGLFNYSLQHIKLRHVLLHRMGLYVKPDKFHFQPCNVPKLRIIVQSSDDYFCEKVAIITKQELDAFTQIFELENKLSNESEMSGDEMDDEEAYLSYRKHYK